MLEFGLISPIFYTPAQSASILHFSRFVKTNASETTAEVSDRVKMYSTQIPELAERAKRYSTSVPERVKRYSTAMPERMKRYSTLVPERVRRYSTTIPDRMKRCSWTMDGTAGNRRSVACSVSPIPPVIEDEVEMELMMDSAAGKMEASRIRTMKRIRWTAGYAVL